MTLDPAALEAFAAATETAPAWSLPMSQQLAALLGRTVATTDAFDSVFRLRPPGWRFGLGEDMEDPRRAACDMFQWDGWQPRGCTVVSVECQTILIGLVACMARAHAVVARQAGYRAALGTPFVPSGLVCVRTRESGAPLSLTPQDNTVYTTAIEGTVRRLLNSDNNGGEWEIMPLDGHDDPWFCGFDNLCPVVPA